MKKLLATLLTTCSLGHSESFADRSVLIHTPTNLHTLFCREADPAIMIMERLVAGQMVNSYTLGTSLCRAETRKTSITQVHSVQRAPGGQTWTLARVSILGNRVGYIVTTVLVGEMEI